MIVLLINAATKGSTKKNSRIGAPGRRRTIEDLRENTAADGIITGVATIDADQFRARLSKAAVIDP